MHFPPTESFIVPERVMKLAAEIHRRASRAQDGQSLKWIPLMNLALGDSRSEIRAAVYYAAARGVMAIEGIPPRSVLPKARGRQI